MRAFGLQTRDELQQTADRLGDAYWVISTAAGVSLRDQMEADGKWRAAALKASGDVESQHLAEQRMILETRTTVVSLGDECMLALGKAETASMAAGLRDVAAAAAQASRSMLQSTQYDKDKCGLASDGQRFTAGGQLKPPDGSGGWEFVGDVRANNLNGPAGSVGST